MSSQAIRRHGQRHDEPSQTMRVRSRWSAGYDRTQQGIASVRTPVAGGRIPMVESVAVDNLNTAGPGQTDQPATFQITE